MKGLIPTFLKQWEDSHWFFVIIRRLLHEQFLSHSLMAKIPLYLISIDFCGNMFQTEQHYHSINNIPFSYMLIAHFASRKEIATEIVFSNDDEIMFLVHIEIGPQ